MADITDALKTDISLMGDMAVTQSGDLATVSGLANVKQALWHRLLTIPGTLVHKPTYGIGVGLYQNAPTSFAVLQKLSAAIQEQFTQDPRVQSVNSVSLTAEDATPNLIILQVNLTIVGYTEQTMNFTPFTGNN